MKISIAIKKLSDAKVESRLCNSMDEAGEWIKAKKSEGLVVMKEEKEGGDCLVIAGPSEEDIFDWYALEVPTEKHSPLSLVAAQIKKISADLGKYTELCEKLELIAEVSDLGTGLISEDARLAVILPIEINKADYDPEDWEFEMKDADTFKWIKVDLYLNGDQAKYLLRNPEFDSESIDEFYFSKEVNPPSLLQPLGQKEWEISPILTSYLPDLDLQKLVEYEFYVD